VEHFYVTFGDPSVDEIEMKILETVKWLETALLMLADTMYLRASKSDG